VARKILVEKRKKIPFGKSVWECLSYLSRNSMYPLQVSSLEIFHLGKLEITFHSHSSQNVQNFGVNTEYHFANILSQSYEKWGRTESKGYPL